MYHMEHKWLQGWRVFRLIKKRGFVSNEIRLIFEIIQKDFLNNQTTKHVLKKSIYNTFEKNKREREIGLKEIFLSKR